MQAAANCASVGGARGLPPVLPEALAVDVGHREGGAEGVGVEVPGPLEAVGWAEATGREAEWVREGVAVAVLRCGRGHPWGQLHSRPRPLPRRLPHSLPSKLDR
jgi:hypothetical protein